MQNPFPIAPPQPRSPAASGQAGTGSMAALTFALLAMSMTIGCQPSAVPAPHPGTSAATPSRPVPTLGPDDAVPRGATRSTRPGSTRARSGDAEVSSSKPVDPAQSKPDPQ